jgi:hypothetical protein
MHIQKINQQVFRLSTRHPVRKFLDAFIACRLDCVGKELDGIDQEWFSQVELRNRSFSSFAYEYLSFDIELDGWSQQANELTQSERQSLEAIPHMKALMEECRSAALEDDNAAVVMLCDRVSGMLRDWIAYIAFRRGCSSPATPDKTNGGEESRAGRS